MSIESLLAQVNFGQRVAEEEGDQLAAYFVETDHWRGLFDDQVDVVYGPKGAGKSALYSLLIARRTNLFDRGILLAPAENPRGAPAFRTLVTDPPASENEFISLWKLYLICVISDVLQDYGFGSASADELKQILEKSGLRPREKTLQATLSAAFEYVKRILRPQAIEGGIKIEPHTQLPVGYTAKIIFGEPSAQQRSEGVMSVDALLDLGNQALAAAGYNIWILLDRLDVAFSDSPELEQNALRALFHVYLDTKALGQIRMKIFLRTDIWRRITTGGFREASHITRNVTIGWNRSSLLNLVVRRIARNDVVLDHYAVKRGDVLASSDRQAEFFDRIFPEQVDVGPNKPNTLDWIIGRTRDGTGQTAPRELIHLLTSLRNVQIRRLEIGEAEPEGGRLFTRAVFKEALPEVSVTRLEQTLYAEFPDLKDRIERLRNEKTQQSVASLAGIWKISTEDALACARQLVDVGFFEQRPPKDDPVFWIPFLYRDALDLVQGAAD